MMANRTMKSYRMDEAVLYEIESIASGLNMTNTEAIEIAVDFFYQSGLLSALENVMKRDGYGRPARLVLGSVLKDGEISNELRAKCWIS